LLISDSGILIDKCLEFLDEFVDSHVSGDSHHTDIIDPEVAGGTLPNLGHDGSEGGGADGISAVHRPTKGNLPRTLLADATGGAVNLGDEGPPDGHITRSTLSGTDEPDGVASLITGELGDSVAGDGKLGHGVSPVELLVEFLL